MNKFDNPFLQKLADYLHNLRCHGDHVERCGYSHLSWDRTELYPNSNAYWEKNRCYTNAQELVSEYGKKEVQEFMFMEKYIYKLAYKNSSIRSFI